MARQEYDFLSQEPKEVDREQVATGQFYADLGESITRQQAEVTTAQIIEVLNKNASQLFTNMSWREDRLISRIRFIADNPAHIRELKGILHVLNLEVEELNQRKVAFKEEALGIRDRTAGVIDHVRPTLEQNFYQLAAEGHLYSNDNVNVQVALTIEDIHRLEDLPSPLHLTGFDSVVHENDLSPDESYWLMSAFSVASAAREKRPPKPNERMFEGAVVSQINTFTNPYLEGVIVPYGEYGQPLAERLASTVQRLAKTLKRTEAVFREAEARMSKEDLQKFIRTGDTDPEEPATMIMVHEGFTSIMQALALLTAQRIPGYETASDDEILQAVVDAGLVEQLARVLPFMGLIGPMVNQGIRFDDLVVNSDGQLKLNTKIVQQLHDRRIAVRSRSTRNESSVSTFHGCPVAIRRPGEADSDLHDQVEFFMEVFATTDNPSETV